MKKMTLIAAALLIAGCSKSPTDGDLMAYPGVVVSIHYATTPSTYTSLHVQGANDTQCGIVFGLSDKTSYSVKEANGEVKKAALESITVGAKVVVYWNGIVLTSCPGQAGADIVQVVK